MGYVFANIDNRHEKQQAVGIIISDPRYFSSEHCKMDFHYLALLSELIAKLHLVKFAV